MGEGNTNYLADDIDTPFLNPGNDSPNKKLSYTVYRETYLENGAKTRHLSGKVSKFFKHPILLLSKIREN